MRSILLITALSLVAAPASAATKCRDAHGKFVKCSHALVAKPKLCRNANGRFAKCR